MLARAAPCKSVARLRPTPIGRNRRRRRHRRSRPIHALKGGTMRYGKLFTTATVLTAFLAAAPLTASAQSKTEEAKDKVKSTTHDAKTAVSDSWITSKTK